MSEDPRDSEAITRIFPPEKSEPNEQPQHKVGSIDLDEVTEEEGEPISEGIKVTVEKIRELLKSDEQDDEKSENPGNASYTDVLRLENTREDDLEGPKESLRDAKTVMLRESEKKRATSTETAVMPEADDTPAPERKGRKLEDFKELERFAHFRLVRKGSRILWQTPEKKDGVEQFVDRYEILGRLGSGGMGSVYRAFDLELQRPIAIKTLQLKDQDEAVRFLMEMETMSQISSKTRGVHVVHGAGILEGPTNELFYTMPVAQGNLFDLMDEWQSLSRDEKLKKLPLFADLAVGLKNVHNSGVLHRDIKPHNILIGESGHLELADFGLVRDYFQPLSEYPYEEGSVLGTPVYMAPEQLSNDIEEVDESTDWFLLAHTFFEMMTGETIHGVHGIPTLVNLIYRYGKDEAFAAEVNESIHNRLKKSGAPRHFAKWIEKMMMPKKEQRIPKGEIYHAFMQAIAKDQQDIGKFGVTIQIEDAAEKLKQMASSWNPAKLAQWVQSRLAKKDPDEQDDPDEGMPEVIEGTPGTETAVIGVVDPTKPRVTIEKDKKKKNVA